MFMTYESLTSDIDKAGFIKAPDASNQFLKTACSGFRSTQVTIIAGMYFSTASSLQNEIAQATILKCHLWWPS